jgi:uncharacterized protein YecT (DUF1311 family)
MRDGDSVSVAAQLEKLEALRAGGTLSDGEFQKLKSALLTNVTVVPKSSSLSAGVIGALAAVAVVAIVFLVAWPRHTADKNLPVAAQPPAQSVASPAPANPPSAAGTAAPPMAAAPAGAEPAAAPPPVFQTSFDCTQATRLALKMICSDPNLAAQDVQLAALYRRARANAIDPSQLSDQQQEWLAARDSCRSPGCLSTVYAQRRAELAQWLTR